jgi:hypothetical protein
MRPNFEEMTSTQLRAYALAHRDDIEPLRVLYSRRNPPDSEATWYGPMHTPEGLPIEKNIKIAEEAIRKRAGMGRENNQYIHQTMTTITQEEIDQFREQLRDYPEALASLDVIQECDGHLEDAVTLLMMRETGKEPDRGVGEWLQKCRTAICQEDVKEALASGLIAPAIEPLGISMGFPPGTATALGILAFKIGIKKLCDPSSES